MTEFTLIPENIEKIVEFANLFVALLAGVFAIKLAALSQGGTMEKTWNLFAIVAVLFVGLEIINSLGVFSILEIHGLSEIVEFVFVATFAYTLYSTRKSLLLKVFG